MEKTEVFTNGLLNIAVTEKTDSIDVHWTGKSTARKPAQFLTPILVDILRKSSDSNKRINFDFCGLGYMNSSTITPLIKVLERAKRGTLRVTVLYNRALKWQDLSFSALEVFQTKDERVVIRGVE
jgi:hypothetical protein